MVLRRFQTYSLFALVRIRWWIRLCFPIGLFNFLGAGARKKIGRRSYLPNIKGPHSSWLWEPFSWVGSCSHLKWTAPDFVCSQTISSKGLVTVVLVWNRVRLLFRSAQTNRTEGENKPESDSNGLNSADLKTSLSSISSLNVQDLSIRRWDNSLIPSKGPLRKNKTALWYAGGAGPNVLPTAAKIQNTKVQFSEEVSQIWYRLLGVVGLSPNVTWKTLKNVNKKDPEIRIHVNLHNGVRLRKDMPLYWMFSLHIFNFLCWIWRWYILLFVIFCHLYPVMMLDVKHGM